MDAKRPRDERRRCGECGGKYLPEPSAQRHQRTCCKRCRQERRAQLARERYAAGGARTRAAARERKRRSRSKQPRGARTPVPLPAEVSEVVAREMAGLSTEGWLSAAMVKQALVRVAVQACARGMSRAGLGAESA